MEDNHKIPEVRARMYLQEIGAVYSAEPITNTGDAGNLLRQYFADADREYFVSVNLDTRGRPISYHVAGIGAPNAVHFAIGSVFKIALLQNAESVLLCHNHPSGYLVPSTEDLTATKQMIDAGKILGIRVLDHFILSPDRYLSLREERGDLFE